MIKKIFIILIFSLLFSTSAFAADQPVDLYLFFSQTCPHCHDEIKFLSELQPRYPNLVVSKFDVSQQDTIALLEKVSQKITDIDTRYVPITVIGSKSFTGFSDSIAVDIEQAVTDYDGTNLVAPLMDNNQGSNSNFSYSSLIVILIPFLVVIFLVKKKFL